MRELHIPATKLIGRLGGLSSVSSALGVSRQAVYKWTFTGIPPAREREFWNAFGVKLRRAKGRGRGRWRDDL
jgi:hypothetical protein